MTDNIGTKYISTDHLTPEQQKEVEGWREDAYKQLKTAILHFKGIKRGDLITINFPATINDNQFIIAVEQAQKLANEYNCEIMVLTAGMTVSHIPAETMKEAGWIRDPDFKVTQAEKGSLN